MIELLVVMTVAAILLALGVPSYRYVTYSNRVSSEINGLLGDLQYARSEAIKEGQTVTVCPANVTPPTPPTACATSSSWQNGWIVFSDINNNHTVASTANILRVSAAFTGSPQDTFVSNDNLTFVSFNREGFATALPTALSGTPTGYATITLHTTPNSAQWTRCLQIFTSGMMGTEKTNDPQGNCS
jgi:type IV fimbrial biogenesis protein FimT